MGGHEYAWHGEFHIPCSPDLQYMLMAMKKERDAGVDVACIFPSSRASRSCRASREISRSPRLAHKAPVMQASVDDDGNVAVESTAFTLSRQFLT